MRRLQNRCDQYLHAAPCGALVVHPARRGQVVWWVAGSTLVVAVVSVEGSCRVSLAWSLSGLHPSPYAKENSIDHHVTEQASILEFVEENWNTGRIGDASFDQRAGSLHSLFRFDARHGHSKKLILDREGRVESLG